jgi:hypothetical protein
MSFRDLKSDGFQWQRSRVWNPIHADWMLLILALAYFLVHQAIPALLAKPNEPPGDEVGGRGFNEVS